MLGEVKRRVQSYRWVVVDTGFVFTNHVLPFRFVTHWPGFAAQRVLERFQTQRESSEHALHNLISDLKAQLAAEATKAQEVVVQAVAKAQEEAVSQQAAAVAEVGEQLRQQEALVAKARQERDALQRALQDSLKRLRSGDGELVDRRIVTKLLVCTNQPRFVCVFAFRGAARWLILASQVTYFERPQSSREVLDLMSRMLVRNALNELCGEGVSPNSLCGVGWAEL